MPYSSLPIDSENRLLIADDHALLRTGMRAMLEIEPDLEVVGEAENGRGAVDLCRELSLSTVKRHLERIISKLEVSGRTQAAVKLGLIDPARAESWARPVRATSP